MGIKIQPHNQQERKKTSFELSEVLTREITLFGSSFNNKKKEEWYSELHVLLKSGIDLKSGLELLTETRKKEKEKQLLQSLVDPLIAGQSFSTILQENKHFTDYEYYAIRIGEQTGQLAQITQELSDFYKRKNDLKREIVSALTYPVIVLCTALLVIMFMLRYVVPMFVDIFKQNKVALPGITKMIIRFSDMIGSYGGYIIGGGIVLILGSSYIAKQPWFRKAWGTFLLKIPILGAYFRKIYLAQCTQALSLLTSARVPMVDSLELVKNMINFYPLQNGLENTRNAIITGDKMSAAFAKNPIFDKKMIALIRVAEETNQTEFIFARLKEQFNQQVKHQSQLIANVLNPILTLLVGLIVGVILVAMYLPMFRLSSVIG